MATDESYLVRYRNKLDSATHNQIMDQTTGLFSLHLRNGSIDNTRAIGVSYRKQIENKYA